MKAVLFDLDDTLYPEIEFVYGGFQAAARFLAARYAPTEDEIFRALVDDLAAHGRGQVFDRVLQQLGAHRPELVIALVHLYRSHAPKLSLFPDVADVLRRLREGGLMLGVLSDGLASVQERKLEALGLAHDLDVVILTDELGREFAKPSPVGFQVALELLNVEATEAAYVGNDPYKDFAGANQLGMQTLRVRTPSPGFLTRPMPPAGEADRHVDPFSTLVEALVAR